MVNLDEECSPRGPFNGWQVGKFGVQVIFITMSCSKYD